jgi:hypothetical protein
LNAKLRPLVPFLTLLFLSACGGAGSTANQPSPGACTDTGTASESWPLPEPAKSDQPPIVSATVSSDTLTLTFTAGTPPYQVIPQPGSAKFAEDPSGKEVDLAGTDGASIVLTGFRGDQKNYTGDKKLTSSGPRLLEVDELGDYEGNVSWAVGLNGPSCAVVTSNGSTLSFLFIQGP